MVMGSNLPNYKFVSYNPRDKHHGNSGNKNFKYGNVVLLDLCLLFPSTWEVFREDSSSLHGAP